MRKAFAIATAMFSALIPAGAFLPSATAATIDDGQTAIFLVPHQDDETTSMGASIKATKQEGTAHIILVLLTDGSESGVCYKEYATTETRDNGGLTPAHRAECTAQRDAEFKAAADQLGVDYIIRADRKQDGCSDPSIAATSDTCNSSNTMTKSYVRSVINDLQATYGDDTQFKSMTYLEAEHCTGCGNGTTGPGHPDHATIGQALLDAYHAGDVKDARFYVKVPMWDYWPGPKAENGIGFFTRRSINLVLNMYGRNAPDAGNDGIAGIGQMSTRNMCEQYDPRPGTDGGSTQRGVLDCSKKSSNNQDGFDYFGDAPNAVYGGQTGSGYPNIADGGADSYIHVPDAEK